jgi:hypothetical protein
MIADIDDYLIFSDIFGDDMKMMAHVLHDLALIDKDPERIKHRLELSGHKAFKSGVETILWSDRNVIESWKRYYREKHGILDLGE